MICDVRSGHGFRDDFRLWVGLQWWVWCGPGARRGGVRNALRRPGGGRAGGMLLVALVLGLVRAWWDGVRKSGIPLGILFYSETSGV